MKEYIKPIALEEKIDCDDIIAVSSSVKGKGNLFNIDYELNE